MEQKHWLQLKTQGFLHSTSHAQAFSGGTDQAIAHARVLTGRMRALAQGHDKQNGDKGGGWLSQ